MSGIAADAGITLVTKLCVLRASMSYTSEHYMLGSYTSEHYMLGYVEVSPDRR